MNNEAVGTQREPGMLTGMFTDKDSSEGAYKSLRDRGYTDDEINVLMSDETRKKYYGDGNIETELGSKAAEGATTGGAIGGTLGAVIAGIAALSPSSAAWSPGNSPLRDRARAVRITPL